MHGAKGRKTVGGAVAADSGGDRPEQYSGARIFRLDRGTQRGGLDDKVRALCDENERLAAIASETFAEINRLKSALQKRR